MVRIGCCLVFLATSAAAQAQPVQGFYVQGSAGLALPGTDAISAGERAPGTEPGQSAGGAAAAANAAINSAPGPAQAASAGFGFGNGLRVEMQGMHSQQAGAGGN